MEAWLRQNSFRNTPPDLRIAPTTDLIGESLVDSIGFLELLVALEKDTGKKLDLSEVDEFTTVAGLWKALAHAAPANAAEDTQISRDPEYVVEADELDGAI